MIYLGHVKYMNHVIMEELEGTRLCRAAVVVIAGRSASGLAMTSGGVNM